MAIQEMEPKVLYIEGKANKVVYAALSRVPIPWKIEERLKRENLPFPLAMDGNIEVNRKIPSIL